MQTPWGSKELSVFKSPHAPCKFSVCLERGDGEGGLGQGKAGSIAL